MNTCFSYNKESGIVDREKEGGGEGDGEKNGCEVSKGRKGRHGF